MSEYASRRARLPRNNGKVSGRVVAMRSDLEKTTSDFCFWQGASGERYVHHVYSLIGCPQLPPANFLLFNIGSDGRRRALYAGRTTNDSGSLNLAEVRYRGANMGATEVHVHLLATDESHRAFIESDMRQALIGQRAEAQSASA